jgi:prophage DNA circulation protein
VTPPSGDSTRITVGAGSFADASAALRLIERIIHDLRPNLGGILVEETTSLAVCDLPNQRLVSPSGQVVLAPTRAQIAALLEADARAFRQSLAKLADRAGAPWTFQRGAGDLIQMSLDTGAASDIVIFAHRNIHPVAGKIVLLSSSTATQSDVAAMSRMLAQRTSASHMMMAVDDSGETRKGPGAAHPDHFATLQKALSQLARMNAQAVLVDLSRGPVQSAEQLRSLIDVARCPVFAFGMASVTRALAHTTHIPPSPARDGQ